MSNLIVLWWPFVELDGVVDQSICLNMKHSAIWYAILDRTTPNQAFRTAKTSILPTPPATNSTHLAFIWDTLRGR
jgi:hypothetical protein